MVPELDLADAETLRDPVAAYGRLREQAAVGRLLAPGFGPMWAVTRHAEARAMLGDPRFELRTESYQRPAVPEDCLVYLRTMQELEGAEHQRLRRLVAPAFTARRASALRPRIEAIVARLVDGLGTEVDLLTEFARPLPIDVISTLVGIPEADRPRWREHGTAVAAGFGAAFAAAIPEIIAGARAAVAAARADPGDDLISDLVRGQADDTELVTLVWHLVLAGQVPINLITCAVHALLTHPEQLAALRADPGRMPGAVEELIRFCGPQLLAIPRYAREDVELGGVLIGKGDPVTAVLSSANRDPRVFADPDRLDIGRAAGGHIGFGHGPHFCLGAALARVETEVALLALLKRFPDLRLTEEVRLLPDPGTARLASLPVAG